MACSRVGALDGGRQGRIDGCLAVSKAFCALAADSASDASGGRGGGAGDNARPDLLGPRVVGRPRVTADAAGALGWPAVGRIAPRGGRGRRSGHLAGRRRGGRCRSSRRRPPSCPRPDSPAWPPCAEQMRPGPRRPAARGATRASHVLRPAMSRSNPALWWQVVSIAIPDSGVTALPPAVSQCGRLPRNGARLK